MMTYQMEHFIVRKTVSWEWHVAAECYMYFGGKNSWTIRELINSWQKKDTKDLTVINFLICIEILCNSTEFNISLSF